jgi:hypothetical protein
MKDNINPSHYKQGKIECIDAIESATINKKGADAYCTGNIIKYLWRCEEKGGVEDMQKALWYLQKMISLQTGTVQVDVQPTESFYHPSAVKPIADISNWGSKL